MLQVYVAMEKLRNFSDYGKLTWQYGDSKDAVRTSRVANRGPDVTTKIRSNLNKTFY